MVASSVAAPGDTNPSDANGLDIKTVFGVTVNVALQRPAIQSSTHKTAVASLAVDGNLTTHSCTTYISREPWLSVDLGTPMDVGRVCVVNDRNPYYG